MELVNLVLGLLVVNLCKIKLEARSLWKVQFKQLRRLKKPYCVTSCGLETAFPSLLPLRSGDRKLAPR
jgi:hypothetical protein